MTSIPSWARRGAKVVCVDGSPPDFDGAPNCFIEGDTYTIAEVFVISGHVACRVEEYRQYPRHNVRLSRFRPLVEDRDDNEIEARLWRARKDHVGPPKVSA